MWTSRQDPEYRRIKDSLERKLASLRQIVEAPPLKRQEILQASPRIKAIDFVATFTVLLGIAGGIFGSYLVGIIGFLIGVLMTCAGVISVLVLRPRIEQSVLAVATHELAPLEAAAAQAQEQMHAVWQEYEKECEWYHSYPPDWNR